MAPAIDGGILDRYAVHYFTDQRARLPDIFGVAASSGGGRELLKLVFAPPAEGRQERRRRQGGIHCRSEGGGRSAEVAPEEEVKRL